ncbi:MAG: NTP transferase domain-containing protein [Oscillospiraceae bacterium]|jgi:bifunctional UDP-N-acetylglucosamine pyrophosphorylase/glucosamine-1-phosphate N-acetyltransferase/UDP-N-acetylglucosamine pyrophosphorylase|nr:NTP transferase domain-containing protein [Oscillospiraceae bacterium]
MRDNISAIVLAGGKGRRLGGREAKVMRPANGKPLLRYVLDALDFLPRENIIIVVGYGRDEVTASFPGYRYAVQEEQLGTGHAALCAQAELDQIALNQTAPGSAVIVCCGDMPLLRRESYIELTERHLSEGRDCTILSGESATPLSFGRVIRSRDGTFLKIAEARDCTPEELLVTELNSGVYAFSPEKLFPALRALSRENAQGEYYLTDAPGLIKAGGGSVGIYKKDLREEILGVNTPDDLALAEKLLAAREGAG